MFHLLTRGISGLGTVGTQTYTHKHITEKRANYLVIQIIILTQIFVMSVSPQRRALITVIDWLLLQEMVLEVSLDHHSSSWISVLSRHFAARVHFCQIRLSSNIIKTVSDQLWASTFRHLTVSFSFLFFSFLYLMFKNCNHI